MPQAKGFATRTILDLETTYGADPSVKAGRSMPFNSNNVIGTREQMDPATITGSRNAAEPFSGNMDAGGDYVVPADLKAIGWYLRAMFGAPTTTGSGTYTHVFKLAGNTQPSFLIERQFLSLASRVAFHVNGCRINRWAFNPSGGADELVHTFGILAANETKISPPSTLPYNATVGAKTFSGLGTVGAVAFTGSGLNDATSGGAFTGTPSGSYRVQIDGTGTPDTFKWSNDGGVTWKATGVAITGSAQELENGVTVTFAATTGHNLNTYWTFTTTGPTDLGASLSRLLNMHCALSEGGSPIATGREFSMECNFNIETDDYRLGGAGVRGDLPEGKVDITGTLKAIFLDASLLDKAIAGTESSLQLTFTKSTHSLTIFIPEVKYTRKTPPVDGPKGIMQELAWRAFYDNATDATSIKVTLVNDVASYA